MKRIAGVVALIAAAVAVASLIGLADAKAGSTASVRVPRVSGLRLDNAEIRLLARGLRYREHGGGLFGIVVKHKWQVCVALPGAGKRVPRGTRVHLYVARPGSC
jgi:beta-lactam-binding protein with PASTA domain